MNTPTRHWVHTGLAVFVAVPVLLGMGGAAYAIHLYASARALINSAREIHTTADAEREIAAWKKRSGNQFWVESRDFSEKTYKAEIVNLQMARLGLAELTEVTAEVMFQRGQLLTVTVAETTGWYPLASVWMREWFGVGVQNHLLVSRARYPSAAVMSFPSSVSENQRAKIFALRANCLVRPSVCKTAADILPDVWQLETRR